MFWNDSGSVYAQCIDTVQYMSCFHLCINTKNVLIVYDTAQRIKSTIRWERMAEAAHCRMVKLGWNWWNPWCHLDHPNVCHTLLCGKSLRSESMLFIGSRCDLTVFSFFLSISRSAAVQYLAQSLNAVSYQTFSHPSMCPNLALKVDY